MIGHRADGSCDFLKIKQGPSAGRTRDVFCFGYPGPGSLKDGKSAIVEELPIIFCLQVSSAFYTGLKGQLAIIYQQNPIAKTIKEKSAGFGGKVDQVFIDTALPAFYNQDDGALPVQQHDFHQ